MPQPIHQPITCATCAYDLTGIPTDAPCPECAGTLRQYPFPCLVNLDQSWLKRTRIALAYLIPANFALATIYALWVLALLSVLLGFEPLYNQLTPSFLFDEPTLHFALLAAYITQFFALYMLTSPDPTGTYPGIHHALAWPLKLTGLALPLAQIQLILRVPTEWAYDPNQYWQLFSSLPYYLQPLLQTCLLILAGRLARIGPNKKTAWLFWSLACLVLACFLAKVFVAHNYNSPVSFGNNYITSALVVMSLNFSLDIVPCFITGLAALKLTKALKPLPT